MRAAERRAPCAPLRDPRHARQRGVSAVEFALLAVIFFALVLGVIETARILFVFNTLQEVTRRAAAAAVHVYPTDTLGIERLKQEAIFRDRPGGLLLAAPVTDASIRIDYLALTRDASSLALTLTPIAASQLAPTAARNRQVCMGNPNAANCIRFVQVSICSAQTVSSGTCQAPRTQMLVRLLDMRVQMHKATTIAPVESFGYVPGTSPCPCP